MKIAVCLSGQPRTIEHTISSILNFFSEEHEYDFFCHSWDYNTYKRKKENAELGEQPVYWGGDESVDINLLHQTLSRLGPKKCVVDSKAVLGNYNFPWQSLFYSLMHANHLKKQYEVENNFRYDFVVRSRFDLIYYPGRKFKLTHTANKDNYLDAYFMHTNRMDYEYNRVNASDTIFYGSSSVMDIISDVYRHINLSYMRSREDDRLCLGPGSSLSDYAELKNIQLIPLMGEIFEAVYRPEIAPMDPLTNFEQIRDFNDSFYVVKKL